MTRNQLNMTIRLTRLEVCDLLLACTCTQFSANDGGEKWKRLREKLREQLNDLDEQLDAIIEGETEYQRVWG